MWIGAILLVASMGLAISPGGAATEGPPWQLPDESLGYRMAPILLLSRPDIQHELGLSADQVESARQAIVSLYSQAAALRGTSGPNAVAARRAVDDQARGWLDTQLSDEQRARLDQIELQWEGAAALVHRPTIVASLDLSEDQRRQLAASIARPSPPAEGPVEAHRRRHRDAAALLSDDQRYRWLAMLGPPFEPGSPRNPAPIPSGG